MSGGQDRRATLRAEVVTGRAGHLFHRWDAAFEQLCDASTLDDIDLDRWRNLIEYRAAWCGLHGTSYHFMVVPEKHVVYEDRLPRGRTISPERPFQRIRAALHPTVQRRVIYPLAELRQARRVEKTYLLTDVHWTDYGAYVGYRALLRGLAADVAMQPIPEPALQREKRRNYTGGIGMRLDPEPVEEQVILRPTDPASARMLFDNKNIMEGQVRIYETDDRKLPRAVIFRDSNLNAMLPFLLGHFSRVVLVGGARFFLHDVIQAEQPDLVITEIAERCLAVPLPPGEPGSIYWTEDLTRLGFTDFTKVPLPLSG
jgi:hypothetical protein